MPRFLMFENFEMPHFSHFQNQIGKMGHFKSFEHKKAGHFKKLGCDHLKTEKEPKMKFFDFGTFQKIMRMLSHVKIIFHMLFGALHITLRNINDHGRPLV